jgi:hypothetical protein
MRCTIVVGLLALAANAQGDATAPSPVWQIAFAGRVIDVRSGRVVAQGARRCPDAATFPNAIARSEAERRKLSGPSHTHVVALNAHHALFASFWRSPAGQGALLDSTSGRVLVRFSDEPAALVEDGKGELLGLIAIDEKAHEVRRLEPNGQVRWRTKVVTLSGDVARAQLDGDRIYVAPFDAISTGAQLYAFDWATGQKVWQAPVREIMAGHSEYAHDLKLWLVEGKLALEGVESAGCTFQLFDPATGARTLEVTELPGGWGK